MGFMRDESISWLCKANFFDYQSDDNLWYIFGWSWNEHTFLF